MESNEYLKYIVYITVNLCNGKIYVGYHKTNPDVWDGYIGCGIYKQSDAKKDFPFHKAVKKYGYENFKRTIIQCFPYTEDGLKAALKLESEIVNSTFLKSKNVYNLALGGNLSSSETKKVYMYALNGEYLRSFKSCRDASLYLNVKNQEACLKAIRNNCLKITNSAFGYFWSYSKNFEYNTNKCRTAVAQYTKCGKFIRHFNSISEAEELLNINTIQQAVTKNYLSGGYQWKYYTGDNSDIQPLVTIFTRNELSPIIMVDLKTNKEFKYKNIKDCVEHNSNLKASQINRVLKKIIKSHKGFYFKYDDSQDKDIV